MRITKLVGHVGIDLLLKRAFPEMEVLDLYMGENAPARHDWRYAAVEPREIHVLGDTGDTVMAACAIGYSLTRSGVERPDVFIVEDALSLLIARQLRARRLVWYCHGDFSSEGNPHNAFIRHALSEMGDAPSIYPTEYKRRVNATWREEHSSLVVPMAVPDAAFVPVETKRNGRACMARNGLMEKSRLYDAERIVPLLDGVVIGLGAALDIYGHNGLDAAFGSGAKVCGEIVPISRVSGYSVGVEPFGNPSVSMAQLEMMAAGVPVITYPREEFDQISCAYVTATETQEFIEQACWLIENEVEANRIGTTGQEYVRELYSETAWKERVRDFICGIA